MTADAAPWAAVWFAWGDRGCAPHHLRRFGRPCLRPKVDDVFGLDNELFKELLHNCVSHHRIIHHRTEQTC